MQTCQTPSEKISDLCRLKNKIFFQVAAQNKIRWFYFGRPLDEIKLSTFRKPFFQCTISTSNGRLENERLLIFSFFRENLWKTQEKLYRAVSVTTSAKTEAILWIKVVQQILSWRSIRKPECENEKFRTEFTFFCQYKFEKSEINSESHSPLKRLLWLITYPDIFSMLFLKQCKQP